MTLHVVAIDDHDVALMGVSAVIETCPNAVLVGTFHSVSEFLSSRAEGAVRVDVVLLDLRLGDGSDPFDNVVALQDAGFAVLVFSSLESPYLLRRAMLAGVGGVIQKSQPAETIAAAMEDVARGDTYATADWAALIDSDPLTDAITLSEQQRKVLELYAMGEPAKRVASLMDISPETVQDYINRIRTRYQQEGRRASTKVDLLRRGQEDGYLPGPLDT
ncbi:response regulator transcription factor [Corynebacterium aquilae]|uniref:Response regulatory domain-containing protein n=1 Tax=Corynebacterium aquilae DSM 44791 TaxID=1431546 RepID=A0A1L7CEM8_9CORY|nr:response regulator transcription factor [Corynebacterium aquilae]APT84285.1 hypothetical protein CAQU_03490 [Corynebacterium aquilae DSM 44791]